jgi:hypothetical protein
MRSFVESSTSTPKGRYYLNGSEIILRGANMMGNLMQCVIRHDYNQLRDDILLAKIVGMNYWRMTQQPCQPEVYDYFDRLGLLAQTDMPCFNGYRTDVVEEAKTQFVEMVKLVRNHPCNAIISYCNEPDFNKPMMMSRQAHMDFFRGFDAVAESLNPGQVTKWIEGDYLNVSLKHSDNHCYDTWYGDNMRNTYFGAWLPTIKNWMFTCGEYGAEGLDRIDLMEKYYPKDWIRTDSDGTWTPKHIPRCQSTDIGRGFLNIKSQTMEGWVSASREYQMWATRLFTEALRRIPKLNSFSIHLLIDAWPDGWLKAIMDTERKAKPAYFAYLDALRPIAVNLRPDVFYGFSGEQTKVAVFICNDTPQSLSGYKLRYQVIDHGKAIYAGTCDASIDASSPKLQGYLHFTFPEVKERSSINVRVALLDAKGKTVHDSNYDLEVFPTADKNKKLDHPGGYPQRLIREQK